MSAGDVCALTSRIIRYEAMRAACPKGGGCGAWGKQSVYVSDEQRHQITSDRKRTCQKCEYLVREERPSPAKGTLRPVALHSLPAASTAHPDEILDRVKVCLACDASERRPIPRLESDVPPEGADGHLLFTWAQHRLGVAGLRCKGFNRCLRRYVEAVVNGTGCPRGKFQTDRKDSIDDCISSKEDQS